MGTVDRLLKATEDIWASYHEKPFVQGLKYGTLDQKKFRSYIRITGISWTIPRSLPSA